MAETADNDIFIVGIGASAGGLEAIRALLAAVPTDAPAAYVIVQHMAPSQRSMLTSLLARETQLEVTELADPTVPEAGIVYVTPPNADVVLTDGKLTLEPPSEVIAAPKPSVDRLLISLAESLGRRAIGVVLSGTGSDGSEGVKAIKEAGGVTFAQDDSTAKYDGMPNSAIETGCIDTVLPPFEIGARFERLSLEAADMSAIVKSEADQTPLAEILQIVLAKTRVDFRDYKSTTILRRLERRMKAIGVSSQREYADYIRKHDEEVDALFRDFLISVTRFFRDKEEFGSLKPVVQDLTNRIKDRPIRVWVAGCATGEEAYSVAILFAEAMGGLENLNNRGLQVFATDIDDRALGVGRRGVYSLGALSDIPANLVPDYFEVGNEGVTVSPLLKNLILFSVHNTVQDPPFRNIDLICCRNLLIYFGPTLQDRAFENFHFSLVNEGMLFLGTADSAVNSSDLFSEEDDAKKILRKRANYNRREHTARQRRVAFTGMRSHLVSTSRDLGANTRDEIAVNALVRAIVHGLGVDGLLLTKDLTIISVFGDMSPYVTLRSGRTASLSHMLLADPLSAELRVLSAMATAETPLRKGFIRQLDNLPGDNVQLELMYLNQAEFTEPLNLLLVRRWPVTDDDADDGEGKAASEDPETLFSLRNQLLISQDALNQTVEQWEATSEELRTANEELQSNNEELQSMNEELETSNEELQSTNEELITINEGYQAATDELNEVNDELQTILEQIEAPLMIVDNRFTVTRFSRAAEKMFSLLSSEGQPHLSQLGMPDGFPSLSHLVDRAIRLGEVIEETVDSPDRVHQISMSAFANNRGEPMGAIIVITSIEKTPLSVGSPVGVGMIRRPNGEIVRCFRKTELLGDKEPEDLVGMRIYDFFDERSAQLTARADHDFLQSGQDHREAILRLTMSGKDRTIVSRWKRMQAAQDDGDLIYTELVDLTNHLDADGRLRADDVLAAE